MQWAFAFISAGNERTTFRLYSLENNINAECIYPGLIAPEWSWPLAEWLWALSPNAIFKPVYSMKTAQVQRQSISLYRFKVACLSDLFIIFSFSRRIIILRERADLLNRVSGMHAKVSGAYRFNSWNRSFFTHRPLSLMNRLFNEM